MRSFPRASGSSVDLFFVGLLLVAVPSFSQQETRTVGEGPLPRGAEMQVNSYRKGIQRRPRVDVNRDGDVLVVWESFEQDGDRSGVFGQLYASDGSRSGGELQINTTTTDWQSEPSVVASPDNRFLVSWIHSDRSGSQPEDVRGRFVRPVGNGPPVLSDEMRITRSHGELFGLDTDVDAQGEFVVTWHSVWYWGESFYGPYTYLDVQRLTTDGAPTGNPDDVYVGMHRPDSDTAVASRAGGDFLVVWGGGTGQHFDAAGEPLGDKRSLTRPYWSQQTDLAALPDGSFLLVWENEEREGPSKVLNRRIAPDGALGHVVQVSTSTPVPQQQPRVDVFPAGGQVVVWASEDALADGRGGLFGRRYVAGGKPYGDAFPINATTTAEPSAPDVAATGDGFVVAWEGLVGDADTDVFAQRFAEPYCVSRASRLCLRRGRFELRVDWRDFRGKTGSGFAVPLTEDTGAFYFFGPRNIELVVKVLDGSQLNGHYWVFYGSLSNVEFTLRVKDLMSGAEKEYFNPLRSFASRGDTSAMPGDGRVIPRPASTVPEVKNGCATEPDVLCLDGGRFRVTVRWQDARGRSGPGMAVPLTDDTGAFYYFGAKNLELVLKVLDGTKLNGHYWVFYGSLSNVGFTIEVRDTVTGNVQRYVNPLGRFASVGDIEALEGP